MQRIESGGRKSFSNQILNYLVGVLINYYYGRAEAVLKMKVCLLVQEGLREEEDFNVL